jgi:flavorubredoxin
MKAKIVFASRSGETRDMAMLIAEGVRAAGAEAEVAAVDDVRDVSELQACDGLVLGSPVYQEEMLPEMRTLLASLQGLDMRGRIGGAFGSFEWNNSVPEQLHCFLRDELGMDMVEGSLAIKPPLLGEKEDRARAYGESVARRMGVERGS